MSYPDPGDPRRQNPPTRAYPGDYDPNAGYATQPGYTQPAYTQPGYPPAEAPAQAAAPRRGPDVDPLMFSGGVVMTGVVTGLLAWLVAWIIRTVADRVTATGQLGVWNPLDQNELWFALVGFLTALVGGALWFVLQLVTPAPDSFYRWIVALLIIAAMAVPLFASVEISRGLSTAALHLVIGLPILTLIPTMGRASRRNRA